MLCATAKNGFPNRTNTHTHPQGRASALRCSTHIQIQRICVGPANADVRLFCGFPGNAGRPATITPSHTHTHEKQTHTYKKIPIQSAVKCGFVIGPLIGHTLYITEHMISMSTARTYPFSSPPEYLSIVFRFICIFAPLACALSRLSTFT